MQIATERLKQCWFLAGPTACGKSIVAIELARRLNAEILSMDSMSLYREMDIGTAKPTLEQRAAVPHHLIDILEPHEESSVAQYLGAAEQVIRNVLERGRIPLFVGGTGLYLRSLLRGVFEGPAADKILRDELTRQATESSPEILHRRLQEVDPAAAQGLHPRDVRRVIRALEVHAITGRPLSEQQRQPPLPIDARPRHVYWLAPPRAWIHQRINVRVEQMVAERLVEEVQRLLKRLPPIGRTARQALGYKEVIEHLEMGTSREAMIDAIQTRTRQFAKRQHTWFRHLEECRQIERSGRESPVEVAQRVMAIAAE